VGRARFELATNGLKIRIYLHCSKRYLK